MGVIKTDFQITRVVEFGDLLKLFVQVFDEPDRVFGLGVGELVKSVIMTMVVRLVIFGFEVEDFNVFEVRVRIFDEYEWGRCFGESGTYFLVDFGELGD